MQEKPLPVLVSVTTEWRSTEWKHVGRFRGSREIEVEAKRDGKPVWLAKRFVTFVVRKGEAQYHLTHAMGGTMNEGALAPGHASRALVIHGMRLDVPGYQKLPVDVEAAYQRARLRVRALLRMYRDVLSALPVARSRKVQKVAIAKAVTP